MFLVSLLSASEVLVLGAVRSVAHVRLSLEVERDSTINVICGEITENFFHGNSMTSPSHVEF